MIPHNLYGPFNVDKNISVVIDVPCINSIWRPFNSNDKSKGHHLCEGYLKAADETSVRFDDENT